MKITMVAVTSLNGKSTRGNEENIYTWTSKEDSELFFSLLKKAPLIVMGSGTYLASKDIIKPTLGTLRIVMTQTPEKYSEGKAGMLEFSNLTPTELVKQLEARGFKDMLLVGGGMINSLFLKNSLVDEIYLTIEPLLFGTGKDVVSESDVSLDLELIRSKELNEKGTMLLHYKIIKHE